MDSFFDGGFDKGIFIIEIIYSIGAGLLIYLSYIYISYDLIGCFVTVIVGFGIKRIMSLFVCMFQSSKLKTFILWIFDMMLLGFVYGLVDLDQFSGQQTFYFFLSTSKLIITFIIQFITSFCFQLFNSDLDGYIKIIQYVLFQYSMLCFSISISWISGSDIKQRLKFFLNIVSLYLSVSCLCLFEEPKGFNIAYLQIIILVISTFILFFSNKQMDRENIISSIVLNGFSDEIEESNQNIFRYLEFKRIIIVKYLSQLIRFVLILIFGIDYFVNVNHKNYNTGDIIKQIHIILSFATSLMFLLIHFQNFVKISLKYQRFKVNTQKQIQDLAKNMKKRTFAQFIQIDLCLKDQSEDLTQQSLIAQNFVDLFLKISEIKMKYQKQIKLKIVTGFLFSRNFVNDQEILVEMLKTIEYAKSRVITSLIDQNRFFEIVLERIQNGLIQNKLTSYLISKINKRSERIIVNKFRIQILVIISFYKHILKLQEFSPQQILYDLHSY